MKIVIVSEPSRLSETPSSLLRRQAALGVLTSGTLNSLAWHSLRFLLYEDDPLLQTRAAGIALSVASPEDTASAVQILIQQLSCKDWFVVNEAGQSLLENFDLTCNVIEKETELRANRDDILSKKIVSLLRFLARRGEAA